MIMKDFTANDPQNLCDYRVRDMKQASCSISEPAVLNIVDLFFPNLRNLRNLRIMIKFHTTRSTELP